MGVLGQRIPSQRGTIGHQVNGHQFNGQYVGRHQKETGSSGNTVGSPGQRSSILDVYREMMQALSTLTHHVYDQTHTVCWLRCSARMQRSKVKARVGLSSALPHQSSWHNWKLMLQTNNLSRTRPELGLRPFDPHQQKQGQHAACPREQQKGQQHTL